MTIAVSYMNKYTTKFKKKKYEGNLRGIVANVLDWHQSKQVRNPVTVLRSFSN